MDVVSRKGTKGRTWRHALFLYYLWRMVYVLVGHNSQPVNECPRTMCVRNKKRSSVWYRFSVHAKMPIVRWGGRVDECPNNTNLSHNKHSNKFNV